MVYVLVGDLIKNNTVSQSRLHIKGACFQRSLNKIKTKSFVLIDIGQKVNQTML